MLFLDKCIHLEKSKIKHQTRSGFDVKSYSFFPEKKNATCFVIRKKIKRAWNHHQENGCKQFKQNL